jgi:hypothetical protein
MSGGDSISDPPGRDGGSYVVSAFRRTYPGPAEAGHYVLFVVVLPADGLPILSMIGAATVDPVDR